MNSNTWVLVDTETNGLTAPIYVVEIGAQRMRGWTPEGAPFRRLINHNADIPPSASRVHGYTREILERDGEDPNTVYRDFAAYVEDRPLVAYNLPYDIDEVLVPEWNRLGISAIGRRGFCALRLAQRLLDPVPAGNCKLQTLRQFYRLPERAAHTAMGDVNTVADLLCMVLRPIAEQRGLLSWEDILQYTSADWFPSRIAFGKHKGRDFREALADTKLRGWLEWLASSENARSASMGQWYLRQLDVPEVTGDMAVSGPAFKEQSGSAVVLFSDPTLVDLKHMIDAARDRLADLEAEYTRERHAVEVIQSRIFERLRPHYQRRDQLRQIIEFRRKYLDTLLRSGENEAEQVKEQYDEAQRRSDAEYEEAAAQAKDRRELSEEEDAELQTLWRKLVRLYHPDRFNHDPQKQQAYQVLTSEINQGRDNGNVERLREIATDPHGFMLRHGLGHLDFEDSSESIHLKRLLKSLQIQIVTTIEALTTLREDSRYELYTLVSRRPEYLETVIAEHVEALDHDILEMDVQAQALAAEIAMLTDAPIPGVK